MNYLNLGRWIEGFPQPDVVTYMVSPFGHVLSEEEAANEEFDFHRLDEAKQDDLRADFTEFLDWLGGGYIVLVANCPPGSHDEEERFEILIDPEVRYGSPTEFLDDFFSGTRRTDFFHLRTGAMVSIGFDLTIWISTRKEIVYPSEFRRLKFVLLNTA